MVLTVVLYLGAKIHSCDSLRKVGSSKKYWNKITSEMTSDLNCLSPVDPTELSGLEELDLDIFDCSCDLKCKEGLNGGIISYYDADKEFCYGKMIEYSVLRNFNYEPHAQFSKVKKIPLFTQMSDHNGWYTGRFLLALAKQLRSTPRLSENQQRYEGLFHDLSDDTILNSCVLRHC